MEQLTTYRAQGKTNGLCFLFKYDLNGNLRAFEIPEGELNDEQMTWLYSGRFPANEKLMQANWVNNPKATTLFVITISPADLSFDALWNLYDHKVSKADAIKLFNKLKEAEVIKVFIAVPHYLEYLKRNPGIGKLHLATYISKRRFDDELPTAPPPKQYVGKVTNLPIKNLAAGKTIK